MERDYDSNIRIANHFKQKIDSYPDILHMSGCVYPFSTTGGEGTMEINGIRKHFLFSSVHYDYVKTMGMHLIAGRDFSEALSTDVDAVVVNEEFVKQFEIENPIGLQIGDAESDIIIGVVENYNYQSLKSPVEPVIHILDQRTGPRTLLVRISTNNIGHTLSVLEDIWGEIQPHKPFNYSFFDKDLGQRYQDERRWNSILRYSSVLAIFITCLGLIGITALTTGRRIKEIGIRKVLGATASQITHLLVRDYVILVMLSNFVTWPMGYCAMHKWLQNYAYRTSIDVFPFLFSGAMAMVIAILTVGYQTVRAAGANPVNSLRDE
jgi:putative ABC transport system permease protein